MRTHFRILLIVVSLLALLFFVLPSIGRGQDISDFKATLKELKALKVANISNDSAGPLVSQLLWDMAGDSDEAYRAKRLLFASLGQSKLSALATVATPPDGDLLNLLRCTQRIIPTNLSDHDLKAIAQGRGAGVRTSWTRKKLTTAMFRSFEGYEPTEAANLAYVVSSPEYSYVGDFPVGATATTWASQSLWNVNQAISEVELVKRSTALKLLANSGYLDLPTSVSFDFDWSGSPSVVIDLSFTMWTSDDIPDLERLLANPYYGDMAQAELDALQAGQL